MKPPRTATSGPAGSPRIPPAPVVHDLEIRRRRIGQEQEFSENWSGTVIEPPDDGTWFYTIGATWTVPNGMPPP